MVEHLYAKFNKVGLTPSIAGFLDGCQISYGKFRAPFCLDA